MQHAVEMLLMFRQAIFDENWNLDNQNDAEVSQTFSRNKINQFWWRMAFDIKFDIKFLRIKFWISEAVKLWASSN